MHLIIDQMASKAQDSVDRKINAMSQKMVDNSFAALFGRLEILPELVAHGADPNHVDARGNTPLRVVLKQGNAESASALRRVGATY